MFVRILFVRINRLIKYKSNKLYFIPLKLTCTHHEIKIPRNINLYFDIFNKNHLNDAYSYFISINHFQSFIFIFYFFRKIFVYFPVNILMRTESHYLCIFMRYRKNISFNLYVDCIIFLMSHCRW